MAKKKTGENYKKYMRFLKIFPQYFAVNVQGFYDDPAVVKSLNKYIITLWSIEAYPKLITRINPKEISQIKKSVEEKLYFFAKKEEDTSFSSGIFMKVLRRYSKVGYPRRNLLKEI